MDSRSASRIACCDDSYAEVSPLRPTQMRSTRFANWAYRGPCVELCVELVRVRGDDVQLRLRNGRGGAVLDDGRAVVNCVSHDQRNRPQAQAEDEIAHEAVALTGGNPGRPSGQGHPCKKDWHGTQTPIEGKVWFTSAAFHHMRPTTSPPNR